MRRKTWKVRGSWRMGDLHYTGGPGEGLPCELRVEGWESTQAERPAGPKALRWEGRSHVRGWEEGGRAGVERGSGCRSWRSAKHQGTCWHFILRARGRVLHRETPWSQRPWGDSLLGARWLGGYFRGLMELADRSLKMEI